MNWLQKIFLKSKQSSNIMLTQNALQRETKPCNTNELSDFIQRFVTEESLEPAVTAFAAKHQQNCTCGCDDEVEITLLEYHPHHVQRAIPELEVLLAGHNAWCHEIELMMRQGQTSEFDLHAVGEGFLCCIGKWMKYDSHGLRDYEEYSTLLEAYQALQECTATMLENHQRGYLIEAIYMLRGEFTEKSAKVQQSLLNLVAAILANEVTH